MKIKDVIEQTGLTDRAIRLYIENELVKPECDVSYNGRRKIDFSDEDVKQLKNIATLRKADFTIAEIKSIMEGGEVSKQTLQEFVAKMTETFEKNRLILKSLEPLVGKDNITVELICSHLDNAVAKEPVPVSDMKMNFLEQRENIFYLCWSGLGILVYVVLMFMTAPKYLYPSVADDFFDDIGALIFMVLPLICPLTLFVLRIIRTFIKKIDIEAISIILFILASLSFFVMPLSGIINTFSPCIQSCTTNPDNYLIVDDKVKNFNGELENFYNYFPSYIPLSAKNYGVFNDYDKATQYYYRFREGDCACDYDIVAQWQLEDEEYEAEKKRLLSKKDDIKWERMKGDWNCIYFRRYREDNLSSVDDYNFIMFAYNDKTNMVRYIAARNSNAGYGILPYYFNLEW